MPSCPRREIFIATTHGIAHARRRSSVSVRSTPAFAPACRSINELRLLAFVAAQYDAVAENDGPETPTSGRRFYDAHCSLVLSACAPLLCAPSLCPERFFAP